MEHIIKIEKNIETIQKYLKVLDDFNVNSIEEFEEQIKDYLAISMSLFTILNCSIEIGEELITMFNLSIPQSYKEIFLILAEKEVLSNTIGRNLSNAMYYRNLIAHQYDDVNAAEIYAFYQTRGFFVAFLEEVERKVKK